MANMYDKVVVSIWGSNITINLTDGERIIRERSFRSPVRALKYANELLYNHVLSVNSVDQMKKLREYAERYER